MTKTNYEKVNRERRLHYFPKQGARSATQRQLDYILALAHIKGQPRPRLPKTMRGASELIDRFLALPDAPEAPEPLQVVPEVKRPNPQQEIVVELREKFPQLSPMTAHSMVQLFSQIDSLGLAFVLDGLMREDAPEDPGDLILFMLRRFLSEFGGVTADDTAMVP